MSLMTGIDVGIVVLKQLVDQEKWITVLHKIGEQCSDVPQFPNHISQNDYRSFTLQELSALKFTEKFNFHGEHMYSGWLCDVSGGQLNNSVRKFTNKSVKRMHYFDKLISSYSYPPIAYFFDIGGFLCFPLFCRHFKSQVIRMTPRTLMVREVLEKCFLIIQEYFPDNVSYFEETTSADYNHCHMKCHLPAG